jgi:phosphoribosylanthranilate isomerase
MDIAATIVEPTVGLKRVRVKICGVSGPADAAAAAAVGADAIGLVFYPDSPRAITVETARAISRALPPFITRVALFLDAPAAQVQSVIDAVRPDALQFHGRETPAFCRGFNLPYIKAVPMGEGDIDLNAWAHRYDDAQALLLDAHRAGAAGGRGERFQWYSDEALPAMPTIMAGGLDAGNVAAAIERFAPYAVDVSSGVEAAPGVKDAARMRAFIEAVTRVN